MGGIHKKVTTSILTGTVAHGNQLDSIFVFLTQLRKKMFSLSYF